MNEGHQVCDSPEWRAAVHDEIIPRAVCDVDLGDDVLEIGPGYGATTDVFAELVPRLTGGEIDPDLAARLQARYSGTHVDVLLGDATRLSFPDGRFSGAVCFSMLHHVPSAELQDLLFNEAARVLRPGAPIVAVAVASDGIRAFHEGDTYQPIDPATLPGSSAGCRIHRHRGAGQRVWLDGPGPTVVMPTPFPKAASTKQCQFRASQRRPKNFDGPRLCRHGRWRSPGGEPPSCSVLQRARALLMAASLRSPPPYHRTRLPESSCSKSVQYDGWNRRRLLRPIVGIRRHSSADGSGGVPDGR